MFNFLSKYTHIEVYLVEPTGLKLLHDIPINGSIGLLQSFRPKNEKIDMLLLTTEKYTFSVLKYDIKERSFITKATGDLKNIFGKSNDLGLMGGVDPSCKAIALHFLQGIIKIIPINPLNNDIKLDNSFNVR